MKTLLLAPELFVKDGGIPRILRLYLKALCELSEPAGAVQLIALNDRIVDSSDLRRYAGPSLRGWEACSGRKARFVRAALLAGRKVDRVVCGHVAQLPVAWAAKKLNPKLKYNLVAHGIEVWGRFSLPERIALRGAERIWCVSEYTRRQLLANCRLPAEKVVVLPNALDPDFVVKIADPSPTDLDILTVCRLSSADNYKGVDHLIEAMPLIRREIPAARLRVVGRGDDLARLQALVRRLNLQSAVTFLGYVNDADMKRELGSCRLFALPSQKEGFGLVYLEAMAHGKPCLGAHEGGTPEVITADTGVLTRYGDVPLLAEVCTGALRRKWDPAAIAARAGEFSYPHFRDRLRAHLFS